MDKLRVRVYNVRFGDAVLISVPERAGRRKTVTRHILIDVGNAAAGVGGENSLFGPVIEDVLAVLDGRPLDLYVMTHEHMDHVQGLTWFNEKASISHDLARRLDVQHAWLTASSAPDYYDDHPKAKKQLDDAQRIYATVAKYLAASGVEPPSMLQTLMLNNNPAVTAECVAYLRKLTSHPLYVYRGVDVRNQHPLTEAKLTVWAPEEDTAVYYGGFQAMTLGVVDGPTARSKPVLTSPVPPPGVDAGAFFDLVGSRTNGYVDNLLAIDRAANNTSVVLCLEWRGRRLLFPGDAELRSWQVMNEAGVLQPVDFLKISHHGSHNGTPPAAILDKILPPDRPPASRFAALSTYPGVYAGVPHAATVQDLERRCVVRSTGEVADGQYVDFEFVGQ